MSIIIEALRAARDMIAIERQSFVDCHSLPGGTLDAEDATIRDEYDAVLAKIDVAIQEAEHDALRIMWIACAERLPEVDSGVLIYAPGWHEPVGMGWWDGETWHEATDGWPVDRVTYWAAIPKGPTT